MANRLIGSGTSFRYRQGRRRTTVYVVGAAISGALVSLVLKEFVDRPRPEFVQHGVRVYTASFPSGHAMMSAVVYLTLAALLARLAPTRRLKLYIMAVAAVLAGMIGLSRVYLGIHWPSDVLTGWSAGAAWALGSWIIAQVYDLSAKDNP